MSAPTGRGTGGGRSVRIIDWLTVARGETLDRAKARRHLAATGQALYRAATEGHGRFADIQAGISEPAFRSVPREML